MPRKNTASLKRDIAPDRKYGSALVQKIINKTMKDGKKLLAEKLVYESMESAAQKVKSDDPLAVLQQAIDNIRPKFEVKSRRVGGANYQVPYEVRGDRQTHLSLMWFIESCRNRRDQMGKPYVEAMAMEIADAYNETGTTIKKREEVHRMAEANRAFAHFAKF